MEFRGRRWLLLFSLFRYLALAEYIYKGCYDPRGLGLRSQGRYGYLSIANCQQQCNNDPLVAMRNGDECLCGGSADLLSYASLTPGLCNSKCKGWNYESCGGNSSVDVYVDLNRRSHSHESASLNQVTLTSTFISGSSNRSSNTFNNRPTSTDISDTWTSRHFNERSGSATTTGTVSSSVHDTWTSRSLDRRSDSMTTDAVSSYVHHTEASESTSEHPATVNSNSLSSSAPNSWTDGSQSSDTIYSSPTRSYTFSSWSGASSSLYGSTISNSVTDNSIFNRWVTPPASQSSKTVPTQWVSSYAHNTWTSPPVSQSSITVSSSSTDSYTFDPSDSKLSSGYGSDAWTSVSSIRSSKRTSDSFVGSHASNTLYNSASGSPSSTSGSTDATQRSSFVTSYYHSPSSSVGASLSRTPVSNTSRSVETVPTSTASPVTAGYVTDIVPTVIIKHNGDETIFMTTTAFQLPSPYNNLSDKSTNPKTSDLSGGAIAGIVVGVIVGVLIILICLGFYIWKRHSVNKELLDLEETKHYQPYSFGDADATSVESPSRNGSIWHKGSPTALSSLYGSVPTAFMSESVSKSSLNSLFMSEDAAFNHMRPNMPSTVFEEPPSIYNGSQRFSTGSLPDMMQERNLTVANPDGRRSRYVPSHYPHSHYSNRKFDDVKEDEEEATFSAGSSGGSYNG